MGSGLVATNLVTVPFLPLLEVAAIALVASFTAGTFAGRGPRTSDQTAHRTRRKKRYKRPRRQSFSRPRSCSGTLEGS
jgi:hypothetical protein